jgi:dsDNA-specific endonuclease/ATPase MutS2
MPKGRSSSYPTLDLHGAVVDEVFDLLDRFLRREEGRGSTAVRIIHGIGTGKVREKALEYCRMTGHKPKPDQAGGGRANPGSFLLFL